MRWAAAVLSAAVIAVSGAALAQDRVPTSSMTPAERQAIEDLVRQYILKNPELILESIQGLREREERAAEVRAQANLARHRTALLNDPASPATGNPKGDVTIVEFFDYRCGYCKRVFPDIQKVLDTDRNVRVVFKEFPILGPDSTIASKAALAAWLIDPDKYVSFHTRLMGTRGALPEARVLSVAADAGLDATALKKAMDDPRVNETIKTNHALAEVLEINGTPAFIIGDEIVRGAIDLAQIKKLISKARGS